MADQRFDYSETAAERSREPGGALQLEQKIEDSAKAKSCSVHKGFDEDVEGISGGECNGQTSKQDVGCNAYVCPLSFGMFMPCTECKGAAEGLIVPF